MSKRFAVLTLALTVAVATVLSASQAKPGSAPAPKSKVLASLQGAWLMISSNGQRKVMAQVGLGHDAVHASDRDGAYAFESTISGRPGHG